jgi:hypothetical protein
MLVRQRKFQKKYTDKIFMLCISFDKNKKIPAKNFIAGVVCYFKI